MLTLITVLFANFFEVLRFNLFLQNIKKALEEDLTLFNLALHVMIGLASP